MSKGHTSDLRFLAWCKRASVAGLRKRYVAILKDPEGPDWKLAAIERALARALDRETPELEAPRVP